MSKASYISSDSPEWTNWIKSLASRLLHRIGAWILRRALQKAEFALSNDLVLRTGYREFLPNTSEDLCDLLGLKIAQSSDPSPQESIQC